MKDSKAIRELSEFLSSMPFSISDFTEEDIDLEDIAKRIEKRERLWKLCQDFIRKQDITCGETVYQTDRVIENAYELIASICKVVGYAKSK